MSKYKYEVITRVEGELAKVELEASKVNIIGGALFLLGEDEGDVKYTICPPNWVSVRRVEEIK